MVQVRQKNEAEEYLRTCLAGTYRETRLDEALAIERRNTMSLVLAAVQEHMACACGGIEGHLRTRGLTSK